MNSRPKLCGVLFNTESKEFRSTEENDLSFFCKAFFCSCIVRCTLPVTSFGWEGGTKGGVYQFHLDSIIYIDYSFREISDSIAGASTGNY